jgi:hypothetical protein
MVSARGVNPARLPDRAQWSQFLRSRPLGSVSAAGSRGRELGIASGMPKGDSCAKSVWAAAGPGRSRRTSSRSSDRCQRLADQRATRSSHVSVKYSAYTVRVPVHSCGRLYSSVAANLRPEREAGYERSGTGRTCWFIPATASGRNGGDLPGVEQGASRARTCGGRSAAMSDGASSGEERLATHRRCRATRGGGS